MMNGAFVSSVKTTVAPSLSAAMPPRGEVVDDRAEHRVVEALPELDREAHAQAVVDLLKGLEAVGHEPGPELAVLRVAGVQPGRLGPRRLLDRGVAGLDPVLGEAVEPG